MTEIDVRERFLARFAEPLFGAARRRIVIWHDADGEFEEAFDGLTADAEAGRFDQGVRPLRFLKIQDGSLFSAKRMLSREDTESDFALYRCRAGSDLTGDLFADVELYAEHFQADGLSLLVQTVGAVDTSEVRGALAELRPFFAAKDRVAAFVAVMPQAQSATDVRAGVLAAALGKIPPTAQAIVRAYALAVLAEDEGCSERMLERLERYGAAEAMRRCVERVTGFGGDIGDGRALMEHLLLSAFAATVSEDLLVGLEGRYSAAHSQFCLGIVHDWAEASEEERAVLTEAAERVQGDLNLEMRFAAAPAAAFIASDVFPAVGHAIVRELATSLAQGADRRAEVREAAGVRRGLSDYGDLASYFDMMEAACAMQDFLRAHGEGYHASSAAAAWNAYAADWWQMDGAYRRFCEAHRRCARHGAPDLSEAADSLSDWAERQYANGFLVPVNECWATAAEADWDREGYVEGVARQHRFYDEVVENELAGAKRVVVIVSDALRYEVAHELADALERSQRVSCAVDAVQGAFPSITSFGMAALLPHRSLSVDAARGLAVLADGAPTATTEQRQAVLQARRPASRAFRAADVLAMKSAEQRELVRDAEVIYLYHNTVDATGEDASTEHDVFGACQRAVDDICGLVRIATNQFKATRIVVTADHGFLYTREAAPATDKYSQAGLRDEAIAVGERYVVAPSGVADDLLLRVSLNPVGGGGLVGLAPRGFVRINRPGGVARYAHGGASLQELCVPVLRVRYGGSRSKNIDNAVAAEVRLLDTNRRITSMLFGVRLYQPEPVSGKVAPATYELVLTDGSGNPVSDVRRAVADRTDADERARIVEVRFALREGRSYGPGEPFYLVARNQDTGEVAWKEEYQVDIAFAPMDDFGF
ncbi:BREX-1 system phosphatase PglZ type A [Adlercreutzia sp. R21]|uniref:BREX-1 system phosphatase PglZ type A n=1 Tax=Adlercreutzia wanghongyangiae TaxID=3111451 RepID=UPI002DBAC92B|nr:BREX-1 system phosphatase PglZ type A [Adlercreutzia sp. R21]MEC4183411.1 BREX-1 system phosphatase PglZ type A [Adlercreutzia sp. R21]